MTHPFHPLFGRQFIVVACRHGWAEERVWFHRGTKRTSAIPLSWTDLGPPDPYIIVGKARSPFRVEDLLLLTQLVTETKR